MTTFDRAFQLVVGVEGGFTANPADSGNWTGGRTGVGECKGTKYGISAASYPDLDIAGLTLDQAKVIYRTDYWDGICGEQMPAPIAYALFDAAVNSGENRAIIWLQAALGVTQDKRLGPLTLAAANKAAHGTLLVNMLAARLAFLISLPSWSTFGVGWSRRLFQVMVGAISFEQPAPVGAPAPPAVPTIAVTIADVEAAMARVLDARKVVA